MDCPSDDELRRWILSIKSDRPHKFKGGLADNLPVEVQALVVKIAREEALKKWELKKERAKVTSAAYEVARRDVAHVVSRYKADKPVRGYMNVYGWRATNV